MTGTGTKVSHSDGRVVYVLKRCSHCGKRKPLEAFSPDVRRPYKVAPVCKDCCNAGVRKSRKTPDGRQKRREEQAKRRLNPVAKEVDRKIAIKGRRTPHGVINTLYSSMKRRSLSRGHPLPKFTKVQLTKWLYDNGYQELYDAWKDSGYNRWMKPSCDRLDDSKGYSFDNMRLVTWKENHDKNKRSLEVKSRRRIQQVDLDGTIVKEWESVSAAKKDLGFEVKNALKRKYLASDGYYYQYADL